MPLYAHDCDCCRYLGDFHGCDLYVCGTASDWPTVIARHSSEPSDYQSGLCFVGRVPSLTEAAKRALDCGALTINTLTGSADPKTLGEALDR